MGSVRTTARFNELAAWRIVMLLTIVSNVRTIQGQSEVQDHSPLPHLKESLEELLHLDNDQGSSGFTLITPMVSGNDPHVGKGRRVVRRKRKKIPTSTVSSVVTSVTLLPKGASGESPEMMVTMQPPLYEAAPRRRPHRRRGNHTKVPEVWKVQNFDINENDFKSSSVEKRESFEKKDKPAASSEAKDDLNYDESYNPFLNSSTPISNELQNSLQFTLQFLHPLLNSDTVLSEENPKVPENKTVAVTHSLSESVAQTPISPDLGFIPTHLKKKHPLLNEDSIFIGDSGTGPSKTGIRTNDDIGPIQESNTTRTSSTTQGPKPLTPTESEPNSTEKTTSTTVTSIVSTTSKKPTFTTRRWTPKPTTTATTTTIGSKPTTSTTTTLGTPPTTSTTTTFRTTPTTSTTTTLRTTPTTSTTTTLQTTPTTSTTTTLRTTPTTSTTTTLRTTPTTSTTTTARSKPTEGATSPATTTGVTSTTAKTSSPTSLDLDHILGILNITEVMAVNQDTKPSDIGTQLESPSSKSNQPNTNFSPSDPTTSKPVKTTTKSIEQQFIEQLIGASGGNSNKNTPNGNDSGEQLLQLIGNLVQVQGQLQNAGKKSVPNILGPLGQPQTNDPATDAITKALLENILLSSLQQKPPQQTAPNPNDLGSSLLNLQTLLTPSVPTKRNPTVPPAFLSTKATPTQKSQVSPVPGNILKPETGLSDADLKSIFELLENSNPTTSSTPKPSPSTTTTPTTTTIRSTAKPTVTTMHPALQSMLDLFNNQLKPFQSVPPTTFLQPSSTTPPPKTTTKAPTSFVSTTLNSLDLLSQLLGGGGLGGLNKVNPVRSTPTPEFSLSSLFGGNAGGGGNLNLFLPQSTPKAQPASTTPSLFSTLFGGDNKGSASGTSNSLFGGTGLGAAIPKSPPSFPSPSPVAESNQLLNFFTQPVTTAAPPKGLYYWFDLNAFLGGDPKADGMAGLRPKMGNRFPFLKIS